MFDGGWRSFRVRLTLWYLALLLIVLSLFGVYLYFQLQRTLLQSTDEGLKVAVAQALSYVADNKAEPDFVDSEEYRHAARHITQAGFSIRLLRPDGTNIAGFGRQNGLPWPARIEPGFVTADVNGGTYQGQPWRTYTQRIADGSGNLRGWAQAAKALTPIQEALSGLMLSMLIAVPVLLVFVGIGGIFLADRALRPVDRIRRTADEISAQDFSRRIDYRGVPDEIGRLAATVDRMLDRIQQAFENERRFTADASHELRTPLAAIKGQIGVALSRSRGIEEYQVVLQQVEREADRLIRLSNDLLMLARMDQANNRSAVEEIDLSELLPSVVAQMSPMAQASTVSIDVAVPAGLSMQGSVDQLIRVFLNIIDNAIKYSPPGGEIHLTAKRTEQWIEITVVDQGKGIAPELLPRLTERFFRVEVDRSRERGGAGLGLSIVNEIVRLHHGRLAFTSDVGHGTCVSLSLPTHRVANPGEG
ncbi:MAG: HAMP domain-containing histidine kinase [Gammaproteobacteria bacterium]|nr:HAMP domain-containing histidine kinase [Gammaproteobacteria bacterium]